MAENKGHQYQYGYSEIHKDSMYDSDNLARKAKKTVEVINDFLKKFPKKIDDFILLDIGCSTGYLTKYYGSFFRDAIGVDIDEKAIKYAEKNNSKENVSYRIDDSMNMKFPDSFFDVVTCTHIYEHVPDAEKMMAEIYRVLKPEGFCYFSAGNKIRIMEPHYRLPFLSVVPRRLADIYVRLAGKADYYEKHLTLWRLRKLAEKFELFDYTEKIIRDPQKYNATELICHGSLKQKLYLFILRRVYFICPTYIWILRKPLRNKN